jgi:hypothetical protein
MRDDLPDVPDPELLDVRANGAREALEALATSTTREAFDWLFDRALERPIHPEGYPESRARFFGPTGAPGPAPANGVPAEAVFRTFRERVAPMTFNAQHPAAFSYFTPPPLPMSVAGETLAQWLQQGVDVWHAGPVGAFVEEEVTHWLADLVGMPPEGWGVLTSGGVMANLMALALAREVHLRAILELDHAPRGRELDGARVYASDQTHFSVARGLDVLGFPADTLRVVASDARFRLRAEPVAAAIDADREAGRTPLAISAVAGSTNTGSVDDIVALAPPTAGPRACRRATPPGCAASSSRTRSPSIRTSGSSRPTTSARCSYAGARISSRRSAVPRSTTPRAGPRTSRSTGTSTRSREHAGSAPSSSG